jgi:hypothetical protein
MIVGSIPPCARTLLYFHAVYRGKIPEVLKTSGARHVFIPLSYGKYFPVQNRCRPASSCVCTGISRSVLLQCRGYTLQGVCVVVYVTWVIKWVHLQIFLLFAESIQRRKIRLIESNGKCRYLKKIEL